LWPSVSVSGGVINLGEQEKV